MSPRKRTLCFVLIFLLLNNDLDFVAGLPVGPVLTEYYPSPLSSPLTRTIEVEGYAPTANAAEIYQTPITIKFPSMPQSTPFIGVASPLSEILSSQKIIDEVYTPNVRTRMPEIYPQTIETITSMPVETTTLHIPSSDIGCCGQQLPVALKINMASPWGHDPVRAVISQSVPAPSPSPSFYPSFSMPPAPIIVIEKSRSKWKSILPILILTLIDGGCGNSGGSGSCSCSQCSAIPVPFPIIIPTNNPVITRGRSKGKGKASTDAKS